LRQVKNSARGETIHVDSSPAFSRDYVHIDDVLTAMVAIAVQGSQPVYNVASGSNLSNRELAKLIQDFSGRKIHFLKDTPASPSAVVDISRLRDDFGLIPEPTETRLISWLSSLDC
jgi:nucleoside-diphosphate-sugar epimerase